MTPGDNLVNIYEQLFTYMKVFCIEFHFLQLMIVFMKQKMNEKKEEENWPIKLSA